jgi:hypothetical protein
MKLQSDGTPVAFTAITGTGFQNVAGVHVQADGQIIIAVRALKVLFVWEREEGVDRRIQTTPQAMAKASICPMIHYPVARVLMD